MAQQLVANMQSTVSGLGTAEVAEEEDLEADQDDENVHPTAIR